MAIQVGPGTKIVFVGDSITANAWFDETQSISGGTNLLVQQLSSPQVTARVGSASGSVGVASGGTVSVAEVTGGGQVYAINSGVGGNQIADIEAAIPARITNYNPDVVVILIGINDCRGVPGPVTLSAFRASLDNIIATTQGTLPGVKILCISVLFLREQWASSPAPAHFSGNPFDSGPASIDAFNAQIAASAAAHGCDYVDARAVLGVVESTLNLPEPGAIQGVLSGDAIHPNAAGQQALSTAVYPRFTFVP